MGREKTARRLANRLVSAGRSKKERGLTTFAVKPLAKFDGGASTPKTNSSLFCNSLISNVVFVKGGFGGDHS
jgi:hypothetical protein